MRHPATIAVAALLATSCTAVNATGFQHPGVFVGLRQLDFIKANIGNEPWKSAYAEVDRSELARLDYTPTPWEEVECGSYSNPNKGCEDEVRDAQAAYTQAVLWRLTGNTRHAENVRDIMNAWANTLRRGHTNSNGPLQAAWSAELFTRAAELVKYTYPGWPQPEKDQVSRMFDTQFAPDIQRMFTGSYACYNKNWHASGVEALMNIAVFNKHEGLFNDALARWRSLVPSYIYMKADGARPADAAWCKRSDSQIVAHWNRASFSHDGLAQETCRDLEHTAYGITAILNAAETARLQGVDLFSEQQSRLVAAMEFHTGIQNLPEKGNGVCPAPIKGRTLGAFEVGYNAFAMRKNIPMPETDLFLSRTRPASGYFHYKWETLTHGKVGDR